MNRILLVDDEASVLAALQRALRQAFGKRVQVETHTDALAALTRAREVDFALVISDLRMPEVDGISFLSLMGAVQPDAARIVLTGVPDFETAHRAVNEADVFRYLAKPWSDAELVTHVEAALHHAEVSRRKSRETAALTAGA